jgi:hypothetical protein
MKEYEKWETGSTVGVYPGYVSGVHDVYQGRGLICGSENVSIKQAAAIVAKYLKNNPERWNEPAYFLVSDALLKAFPCDPR